MGKVINHVDIDDTLGLSECNDGFWLYDSTRGMNLAMRAKTKDAAFVEAIKYYQERLNYVEQECNMLRSKIKQVADIVAPFNDDDE